MATLLDGRELSAQIRAQVKQEIKELNLTPGLAVILVGDDPASKTYVDLKQQRSEEVGVHFELSIFDNDVAEETLVQRIEELNRRTDIHGILVQLPLPNQDADRIISTIDPKKDVDGFHKKNLELLRQGKPGFRSAVALGIIKLIEETGVKLDEQRATLICSPIFAEPLEILLNRLGVSTNVVSVEDEKEIKKADIVIVAIGQPNVITGDMIKPGAIVIDVGTTKVNGHLVGDIDAKSVEPVAGFLTPVPGGVGPMTVAMLLVNVLEASKNN